MVVRAAGPMLVGALQRAALQAGRRAPGPVIAPHRHTLVRRLGVWASIKNWIMADGRVLIGEDDAGNKYWQVPQQGEEPARREIEYPTTQLEDIDFESIPSEWRLWVRGYRDDPPTPEEIYLSRARAAETIRKAREIDAQDALEREKQLSRGELRKVETHAVGVGGGAAGGGTPPRPPEDKGGESVGSGETFSAGSWDPNSLKE